MTKTIFVDYSTLDNPKTVSLVRDLSSSNKIIAFSCDDEYNRRQYEDNLIDLEIGADELVLRPSDNYSKSADLVISFVLDEFHGHDEKAIEQTSAIICNNERFVERLREEGFYVISTEWN